MRGCSCVSFRGGGWDDYTCAHIHIRWQSQYFIYAVPSPLTCPIVFVQYINGGLTKSMYNAYAQNEKYFLLSNRQRTSSHLLDITDSGYNELFCQNPLKFIITGLYCNTILFYF